MECSIFLKLDECMTLWGEPDRVHGQNIKQLHTYVTEPQATENHKTSIHVHTGTMSQGWLYLKHAARRLVQHMLQVVEMAWTDDSILAIFFYKRYW